MLKNILLILALTLSALTGFAGSTGFVFEGKTYYQFKDGVAVNETPKSEVSRSPASVGSETPESMILYFTEDDYVRCYYWNKKKNKKSKSKKNKDSNIHCLKLSDIKERS